MNKKKKDSISRDRSIILELRKEMVPGKLEPQGKTGTHNKMTGVENWEQLNNKHIYFVFYVFLLS